MNYNVSFLLDILGRCGIENSSFKSLIRKLAAGKKITNPCYVELKLYTFPEKFPKIIPIHVSLSYFEFERSKD